MTNFAESCEQLFGRERKLAPWVWARGPARRNLSWIIDGL